MDAKIIALGKDGLSVRQSHETYLLALGERVRTWRARRGMSRKMLARDSNVSERYLAQLETGKGNISIALLRQVAFAMHLPLEDLTREGPELPADARLILEHLRRMDSDSLAEARQLIGQKFAKPVSRHTRIAFIGLRGAGKSTLGRALAQQLDVPFVQIGAEVARMTGMELGEIFSLLGQSAYRRIERQALETILEENQDVVIEAGGGIVSETETFARLLAQCYTIWLKTDPEQHMARVLAQGDKRPMSGNREAMADLRRILQDREGLYAKADMAFSTTNVDLNAAVDEILAFIEEARMMAIGQEPKSNL
jgi:XRE family aerobic/anaerobic benzoate catabolism transcriptional regulator